MRSANQDPARELDPEDFRPPQIRSGVSARLARVWRAFTGENLEWKMWLVCQQRNHWYWTAKHFEQRLAEREREFAAGSRVLRGPESV